MQASDAKVIERFLTGDRSATHEVDQWIQQAGASYRRRLSEDWEDVLQDIRLELTRLLRQGAFRGESSFKTYLWRVVSHACLDRIRATTKRRWEDIEPLELSGHLATPPVQDGRNEWKDLLLRVLDQTPEDCRQLWQLVLDGYSYREMSRRMGIAEGTLRVRVLRCRKKALAVRDALLGADFPEDPELSRNNSPS